MKDGKRCFYCNEIITQITEHVFPKGLGGEDIYIDCVCKKCNTDFSVLERELFRNSMLGLMRSIEGIEGYSNKKLRRASLSYPDIYQFSEKDKMRYEVGIYEGFKHYLLPQLIQADENIYLEASDIEEMKKFCFALIKWKEETPLLIEKFSKTKSQPSEGYIFTYTEDNYTATKTEVEIVRNPIIFQQFNQQDENSKYFQPRLYYSDTKQLILKGNNIEESIAFLKTLLTKIKNNHRFVSHSSKISQDTPVNVSFGFNPTNVQRALVKIGLNALIHYRPELRTHKALLPAAKYVTNGLSPDNVLMTLDQKNQLLDIDSNIHCIRFIQGKHGLMIRMSLFGGGFVFFITILKLLLSRNFNQVVSELVIDYKNKKQNYYPTHDAAMGRLINAINLNSK